MPTPLPTISLRTSTVLIMTAATLALVATTAGAAPEYSYAVTATTPVGAAPLQVTVSPAGAAAFVANAQSNDVSATNTEVVAYIPVGTLTGVHSRTA
ncbi:hypothetical protein ACWEK5_49645 [Rhodococcus koreensis]